MKLAIFGATGRTGQPLVHQALELGHSVVALVRTPTNMPLQHERLTLVQGDVTNPLAVSQAVQRADAVLSVLGPSKSSPPDVLTIAARHLVAAMHHHQVKRLISLVGAGISAPEDRPTWFHRLVIFALKRSGWPLLKDGEQHAKIIQQSGLDWVIVRGPYLTQGPHTGTYRVGWLGVKTGWRIARADLADFLLTLVENDTYVGQLPLVTN